MDCHWLSIAVSLQFKPPELLSRTVPLVQGQWLVHGGESAQGKVERALWVFDFSSLAWSKADVGGTPLEARAAHSMACHNDAVVIMGGWCLSPYPGEA